MIISASYRTDIPAFHAEWFAERFSAGFCEVRNPYSNATTHVSLAHENVDGFVFWTRRLTPFLPMLNRLKDIGAAFVVHYTITGYPRELEPALPTWQHAVREVAGAARQFGPRTFVWRYDPVLLTSITPPSFHRENFSQLAKILTGEVDEVILSFAHIYQKTRRNIERAANHHGFTWRDPESGEKRALLADLAAIAAKTGLRPTLCAQPELSIDGLEPARCIDAARLSDVKGKPVVAREKSHRTGCLCAESRDIGAYDTCVHGCVYCYAVRTREIAKQALLIRSRLTPDDRISL
ncbi:MAG: DNA repair photolyase [Rhodospirillaceae bacterium]|nr:DNA repair photolyase [Rhodospirillaceae bacterium]